LAQKAVTVKASAAGTFPPPVPELRCAIQTDAGQEPFPLFNSTGEHGDTKTYEFRYDVSDAARSVDITLAFPRVRVVEFTARPTRASVPSDVR
jgi:hypothetical protein